MKNNLLFVLVGAFVFVSMETAFIWATNGVNSITGDEPHYLIMTDGLIKYRSFEQTKPYKDEFASHRIFEYGLAPEGAEPRPDNTHAVLGPNGLFNVHNIGLPILLVVPFLLGGIAGAKTLMILIASAVVYMTWKLAQAVGAGSQEKFWITLLCCFSASTIPASNQIYPDLSAGLISLVGLYWLYTLEERRSIPSEALLAALISFLPWLQIKFGVASVVLISAVSAKIYYQSKDWKRVLTILTIAGISCSLLMGYNSYAFGKISGPYQDNALEISRNSLMVLLALVYDQNQGFLFQNPVFFIGLTGIGILYRSNRFVSVVWLLVFLSLLVPNSMHPNWFGGLSFSGRFELSSAMVFIMPTVLALSEFFAVKSSGKWVVTGLVLLIQVWCFYAYAVHGVSLYNKGPDVWPDIYSNYYFPIDSYLPMLYNVGWAYKYPPNYAWLVVVCLLIIYGFNYHRISHKIVTPGFVATTLLIFAAGFFNTPQKSEASYSAAELPSITGDVVDSMRVARTDRHEPGFLSYGPYIPLRKGKYEVKLTYSSPAGTDRQVLLFDVVDATKNERIMAEQVNGSGGGYIQPVYRFELTNYFSDKIELRTFWPGENDVDVKKIDLKKID